VSIDVEGTADLPNGWILTGEEDLQDSRGGCLRLTDGTYDIR
jgi:hypothetical protein